MTFVVNNSTFARLKKTEMRQTKIVATISDQRCEKDFIKSLYDAGMNVVRLNSAHLDESQAAELIEKVHNISI